MSESGEIDEEVIVIILERMMTVSIVELDEVISG